MTDQYQPDAELLGHAYSNIRANANRRMTLRSEVVGSDLCEQLPSARCSLCTSVCLRLRKCLNEGTACVQRHRGEGLEGKAAKEGEDSRHVTAGRLKAS